MIQRQKRESAAFTLLQKTAWQITSRISNLTQHKDKPGSILPSLSDKALQILCRNCVNLHKCLLSHLHVKPYTSVYHYCHYNMLVTTKMWLCCPGVYCLISGFEVAVSALSTNYGFVLMVWRMMFKKKKWARAELLIWKSSYAVCHGFCYMVLARVIHVFLRHWVHWVAVN